MDRIYLASPYSHPDRIVRETRYLEAVKAAGRLMKERPGCAVFSPIAHSHMIAEMTRLPGDFEFWQAQDVGYIDLWATRLAVLKLDGWQESRGVMAEIARAEARGLPVEYLEP